MSEAGQIEPLLLTSAQCAALCGVSEREWYRWKAKGQTPEPFHKSRRCVRWHRDDVVEWLRAGKPDRSKWEREKNLTARGRLVG